MKFANIFSSLNFLVYFGFSRKFHKGLVSLLIGGKNKSGVRDLIFPLTPFSAILIYATFNFKQMFFEQAILSLGSIVLFEISN